MTRRPARRSQPPPRTRLQPAQDRDYRLGLLFIKEVTRSRHGVKGEGPHRALQQPHLVRPYVALMRNPAQDEAHRTADLGEVGPQLLRLARVRHRQIGLQGRVETLGGTGGVADHYVVRDPRRIAGRREQHRPDLLPDELDAAEQLDPGRKPERPLERRRDSRLGRPAFERDESADQIGATVGEPKRLRAAEGVRNHERLTDGEGIENAGSLQPSTWLRALWEMICEAVAVAAVPGAGGAVGPGPLARASGSARRRTRATRRGPTPGQSGDRFRAGRVRSTGRAPAWSE